MPQERRAKPKLPASAAGYLQAKIGRVDRLSADEERALARAAKAGDQSARERMVLSNVPLALKVAREWSGGRDDRLDRYAGAALFGLVRAVDGFDPGRGFRLSTYVGQSVRFYLERASREEGPLIHVPVYLQDVIARVDAGRSPSGRAHGTRAALFEFGRRALAQAAVGWSGLVNGDPLGEVEDEAPADDELPYGVSPGRLHAAIDRLPPHQAQVIRARFFHSQDGPPTCETVASRLGLTRSAVSLRERTALAALREMLAGDDDAIIPNPGRKDVA